MRALAEYVMRGRVQAASVALLCTFLPLVSPAIVALVTLRRGLVDGLIIALWAFLPVVVLTVLNPSILPMTFISLSVLVALIGGAIVLKAGSFWPASVLGLVFIAVTGAVAYGISFPDPINELIKTLNNIQQEAIDESGVKDVVVTPFTHTFLMGVVAFAIAINALMALLIGRWWQAILYNPGGFREEFHQLHMSKTQSLFCLGLFGICFFQSSFRFWGLLAAIPLFMVSAAIIHHRVYQKKRSVQWLVLFYILAFVIQPILWITCLLGFTDAWVDYRRLLDVKNIEPKDK